MEEEKFFRHVLSSFKAAAMTKKGLSTDAWQTHNMQTMDKTILSKQTWVNVSGLLRKAAALLPSRLVIMSTTELYLIFEKTKTYAFYTDGGINTFLRRRCL